MRTHIPFRISNPGLCAVTATGGGLVAGNWTQHTTGRGGVKGQGQDTKQQWGATLMGRVLESQGSVVWRRQAGTERSSNSCRPVSDVQVEGERRSVKPINSGGKSTWKQVASGQLFLGKLNSFDQRQSPRKLLKKCAKRTFVVLLNQDQLP